MTVAELQDQKIDERMRLIAQILEQEPEHTIQNKEQCECSARTNGTDIVKMPERNACNQQIFEYGIDLRGVTQTFGTRYFNAPGECGDDAVEFLVDKVAETPECKTNGNGDDADVGKRTKVDVVTATVENKCNQDSQKTSVRGHTSVPNRNDVLRMGQKIQRLVEEDVTKPSANDHAKDGHGNDGCPLVAGKMQPTLLLQAWKKDECKDESKQVHNAIPVDGESKQIKKNGA
ncbi:hypothetical protein A3D88_02855 [Candidatus Peribacteria bacterium RIFCSPHIGHO2_02_FULL_52_16]|nr:MAG: hypothetical protein A2706_00685 [Candidatus Peribacteria bacterium RIFCSPHIGHO2_01_FULL_51_35]OGJ61697.1 MAG: hypothetical protein A3D88_02855 [Candidatus Peribacteria bacterium RIFCSPHIGHO2_02_FULL_52_16]